MPSERIVELFKETEREKTTLFKHVTSCVSTGFNKLLQPVVLHPNFGHCSLPHFLNVRFSAGLEGTIRRTELQSK